MSRSTGRASSCRRVCGRRHDHGAGRHPTCGEERTNDRVGDGSDERGLAGAVGLAQCPQDVRHRRLDDRGGGDRHRRRPGPRRSGAGAPLRPEAQPRPGARCDRADRGRSKPPRRCARRRAGGGLGPCVNGAGARRPAPPSPAPHARRPGGVTGMDGPPSIAAPGAEASHGAGLPFATPRHPQSCEPVTKSPRAPRGAVLGGGRGAWQGDNETGSGGARAVLWSWRPASRGGAGCCRFCSSPAAC